MRHRVVQHAVWPNHHGKEIIEAKWRRYVEPIVVLEPDADSMNNRRVTPKCFIRRGQSRVWSAEASLEPQMHAGLVSRLYRTDTASGSRGDASDYRILGRPG